MYEQYCNFTYSLLGIETSLRINSWTGQYGAGYCNFTYSLLGIETWLFVWKDGY